MPLFDHFNLLAPLYDRVITYKEPVKIIELGGFPVNGIVLDAGGGTGRISQALVGKAAQVIVLDLSYGMLQKASQKDHLEPVCSHTEALPFADESFEVVVMVDALHHVHDQSITAQELFRVVKPGGRIVVEEPDIRIFAVKLVAVAEKLALMRSRFLSPDRIAALFPPGSGKVTIERDSHIAWVIIEKRKNSNISD